MKVVGISGSARKDGNTAIAVRHVFLELEIEGIETELIQLSGKKIHGCTACYKCWENKDYRCAVKDDVNACIEKMQAAVVVAQGGGSIHAFDSLNHFF